MYIWVTDKLYCVIKQTYRVEKKYRLPKHIYVLSFLGPSYEYTGMALVKMIAMMMIALSGLNVDNLCFAVANQGA